MQLVLGPDRRLVVHERPHEMTVLGERTPLSKKINLKKHGLMETTPRLAILKILELGKGKHVSAEAIYRRLLKKNIPLPMSTVYRVLGQFESAGIVQRHIFDAERSASVFELNTKVHHDHMICITCGAVSHFVDKKIEERQLTIAKNLGFELTDHSLNMYGVCCSCVAIDAARESVSE